MKKSPSYSHGQSVGQNDENTSRTLSRSNNLNEHLRLVKQKKDEADLFRLQRLREQLRKKEEKW